MRGYFDDEEAEREAPEDRGRDTELTLGVGALLGIVFGLVLVCGVSFWLGYAVGHHGSAAAPATAAQPAAPTAAPDQEPLQGNGSIPKPSADAQAPALPVSPASDGATPPAADGGANPATTKQGPAAAGQTSPPASSPASAPAPAAPTQTQSPVRPAFPAAGNGTQGRPSAAAPNVHAALPGAAAQVMVQVAAVSHQEDADVLVNALRKRGYAAGTRREPSDGLIHVRIGPFATRDEANRMCTRLLNDGYNAMVQP
jgi:cell division septation protein DedD